MVWPWRRWVSPSPLEAALEAEEYSYRCVRVYACMLERDAVQYVHLGVSSYVRSFISLCWDSTRNTQSLSVISRCSEVCNRFAFCLSISLTVYRRVHEPGIELSEAASIGRQVRLTREPSQWT
jgi:hypothetical protein